MRRYNFDCYEDFCDKVVSEYVDLYENDDLSSVYIIAKYDDAREIIQNLIYHGLDIRSISELSDVEISGYCDEFLISIFEHEIWCAPMKRDGKYIDIETQICYVFEDCSSTVIGHIHAAKVYEFGISDDYEEDDYDIEDEDFCNECCECTEKKLPKISDVLAALSVLYEFFE